MNDKEIGNRTVQRPPAFQIIGSEMGFEATRPSKAIFLLLCTVPILTTLLYGGVDTIVLGLQAVIAALLVLLWLADGWLTGELRFSCSLLPIPIAGLILIGLIQLLPFADHGASAGLLQTEPSRTLSLDPFATKMFVVRLSVYLIFLCAALAFVDTPRRAKWLAVTIVLFGALIAFFGILQRMANPEAIYGLRPTPQAIPFGPFVNQHHFAAFMEMAFGLTFGLLLGGGLKHDRRAFLILAAVLMAIGLVFTGSRGGVISLAGVIVFVTAATYIGKIDRTGSVTDNKKDAALRRAATLIGSAALALIIVGSVFYLGGGDSLLRGLGVSQGYEDISSGRIHYWTVALKIFASNPIIGTGLDTYAVAFSRFDTQSGMFRVENAHNDYIQALSDAGIFGFLCVAAFLAMLFRSGFRAFAAASDRLSRSISVGAIAGCFGVAIHSFFDFPLRTPSNALFFLLLAVLGTASFYSSSSE